MRKAAILTFVILGSVLAAGSAAGYGGNSGGHSGGHAPVMPSAAHTMDMVGAGTVGVDMVGADAAGMAAGACTATLFRLALRLFRSVRLRRRSLFQRGRSGRSGTRSAGSAPRRSSNPGTIAMRRRATIPMCVPVRTIGGPLRRRLRRPVSAFAIALNRPRPPLLRCRSAPPP